MAETSDLFRVLQEDMRVMKIERRGVVSMIFCFFTRSDFLAVALFRLSAFVHNKGLFGHFASRFLWRLNILLSGSDIDPRAQVSPGLSLPHPFGIVIGCASIGRNVEIMQNVTLGRRGRNSPLMSVNHCARIGNDVTIYAGAVVAGALNVGDGSSIGANAVVLHDVPPGHLAVGVPAKNIPPKSLASLSEMPLEYPAVRKRSRAA